MVTATSLLDTERAGDVLVVTPTADLRESEFRQIGAEAEAVLALLSEPEVRGVVIDFGRTDYFGSTALGFFAQLVRRAREAGKRVAFCNLSDHEREILGVTALDRLCPAFRSKEEAVAALGAQDPVLPTRRRID